MRKNERGLFMFAIGCLLAVCMDEAAKRVRKEEPSEVPFEEEVDAVEEVEEIVEPEEEFEPTEEDENMIEELFKEFEEEIFEDDEE